MVTFEITVGLVFTSAHEKASLMMNLVNISTNPTSTKMESWIEVVQSASLKLENYISRICEGDAWVCVVQIVAFKNVCAGDLSHFKELECLSLLQ
jgi:hypothetical protein